MRIENETKTKVIPEISMIEICTIVDDTDVSLEINPKVDFNSRQKLIDLFVNKYVLPKRPDSPNIHTEMTLRLTEYESSSANTRRLSFAEKKIDDRC